MTWRASSLPLLMKCTGSLVLPHTAERSDKADDAADWGSLVHRWAQTGEISKAGSARHASALKQAIAKSGIDRLAYWPLGGVSEGALALRIDGKREANRDDTPRRGWLTGHYDFQWWVWGDELWVDDIKTNRLYPNPAPPWPGHDPEIEVGANRFPPDVASPQLKLYALALCLVLGYLDRVVHVSLTHWPRLPLTARHALPERHWVTYSPAQLLDFYGQLEAKYQDFLHNEQAIANPFNEQLRLLDGAHCRFCPSLLACPQTKEQS